METQDDIEVLRDLGLAPGQAMVYLALVQLGRAGAKTISKKSNVARSDVYRIIIVLQKLGLVEKIITTPLMFKAIPLEVAISLLLNRRAKEHVELHQKTKELIQKYKMKNKEPPLPEDEPQFVLIPPGEISIHKRKQLIDNTRKCIDIITSRKRFPRFTALFADAVTKALKRGVEVRLVLEEPEKANSAPKIMPKVDEIKKHPSFKIKHVPKSPSAIVTVYDKSEALIVTLATSGMAESHTLWSNNPSLVSILNDYFEITWLVAKENLVVA